MDDSPKKINTEWTSPYLSRIKNGMLISSNRCSVFLMRSTGPPTQGRVYQTLLQEERIAELAGKTAVGDVQMINTALEIESDQYVDVQAMLCEYQLILS